eukprot:CAMPEP_0201475286 /NCGR_PEP_ID=MMETSP0151_2-20130828/742_1 /ASSEMBLY_ACC=CAM_ASM_000257 /TAXON_ID=200890 /ORGANISM="Paramoeba atlantica, Strain 621/1 / CCAP 1560/9" /LENGTH=471 /DNA_ID=CAMNT_0047855339 /DNA_START=79 /DNA_END=1494 /DNA_ORIENTATION=-
MDESRGGGGTATVTDLRSEPTAVDRERGSFRMGEERAGGLVLAGMATLQREREQQVNAASSSVRERERERDLIGEQRVERILSNLPEGGAAERAERERERAESGREGERERERGGSSSAASLNSVSSASSNSANSSAEDASHQIDMRGEGHQLDIRGEGHQLDIPTGGGSSSVSGNGSGGGGASGGSFYNSRMNPVYEKHTCQRCQKAFAARSSLLRHARKCPMLHFHPYAAPTSPSPLASPSHHQLFSVFTSSISQPLQGLQSMQGVRMDSAPPPPPPSAPSSSNSPAPSSASSVSSSMTGCMTPVVSLPLPYPQQQPFSVPPLSRDTLDEEERIISVPSSDSDSLAVVFGEVDGYCIGRKKHPPPNTPLPIIITDMVCFLLRTRNRGGFMPTNSTWRHPIAALLLKLGLSREDLDNTLGLNYKNRKTPSLEHSVLQVQQKTTQTQSSPPPSRPSSSSLQNRTTNGNTSS